MPPAVLFHVLPAAAWAAAAERGAFDGPLRLVGAAEVDAEAARALGAAEEAVALRFETAELPGLVASTGGWSVAAGLSTALVAEVDPLPWTASGHRASTEVASLTVAGERSPGDVMRLAASTMRGFDGPWWVAGGWSVSLHLGRRTRPHADLEVSILHRDHLRLYASLPGWELRLAGSGAAFERWRGWPLSPPIHQCWARPGRDEEAPTPDQFARDPEFVDVLFEAAEGDEWVYRRDRRIRLPFDRFGTTTPGGTPIVAPEVSLLFKAKEPRWKDDRDLRALLPTLGDDARRWLGEAIALAHPTSPWRALVTG